MSSNFEHILIEVQKYKRRYQLNRLLKGLAIAVGLIVSVYLIFNTIEFFLYLPKSIRAILFFSFVILTIGCFGYFILKPFLYFIYASKHISDEKAAREIGNYYEKIDDKLLNSIQLYAENQSNELAQASIIQKANEFSSFPFSKAITFKESKAYLKLILFPLSIFLILVIFIPAFIKDSTQRIIHYTTHYQPNPPFQFLFSPFPHEVFRNEDVTIQLKLSGNAIPEYVYLVSQGRKYKMQSIEATAFSYTFTNIQKDISFLVEAGGFTSNTYDIYLIEKPEIRNLGIHLTYPAYLHQKEEFLTNVGNITVPEGTIAKWMIEADQTDSLSFQFSNQYIKAIQKNKNEFTIEKKLTFSQPYTLNLKNKSTKKDEKTTYLITVIPDEYPQLEIKEAYDSVFYNVIFFSGKLTDDHGLTKIGLYHRVKDQKKDFSFIEIPIGENAATQVFFYQWNLEFLSSSDQILEYFWKVWDNDAPHGFKSTTSNTITYKKPSSQEIQKSIEVASEKTEKTISSTLQESKSLQEEIEKMQQRMKTQSTLSWEDKKQAESLLQKKESLAKQIEELKKEYELTKEKSKINSSLDEKTMEKLDQLEKLFQELVDKDTKQLYEQLQKMLEENKLDQVQNLFKKINQKENNLEKELERTLDFFKQIQFDQKLDQTVNELQKQSKEQQQLAEEGEKKKMSIDSLLNKQEQLNKKFEQTKKDIESIQKLGEKLSMPPSSTQEQEKNISEQQQQSKNELEKNNKKAASNSQKKASQSMNQLASQLKSMQQQMESKQIEENIEQLENLLDNLVKLSFSQEGNMKKLNSSNQISSSILQNQNTIKEQTQIVKDSLLFLSKRVPQIQSFVTREVDNLTNYVDESIDQLKKKRVSNALSKQQFSMMTMNNLALLLSDILKQLQQAMANAKGGGKSKNSQPMQLGDLQKELNQKIQQLKEKMEKGQPISEELAKLAAQQEMIRNALKELESKFSGQEMEKKLKESLNSLNEEMKKTEKELVNKQMKQETILRQQEILTRLLETEKAIREKEIDKKRESKTAQQTIRTSPTNFSDFFKANQKEIELLKTIPLHLNLFYKEQVNQYFNKLKN